MAGTTGQGPEKGRAGGKKTPPRRRGDGPAASAYARYVASGGVPLVVDLDCPGRWVALHVGPNGTCAGFASIGAEAAAAVLARHG